MESKSQFSYVTFMSEVLILYYMIPNLNFRVLYTIDVALQQGDLTSFPARLAFFLFPNCQLCVYNYAGKIFFLLYYYMWSDFYRILFCNAGPSGSMV
jgi:hypothetical protein